jgi:hypothetical protein
MGGALFMGGAAALAGDFALLFRRHRRKSTTFFSYSVHSILLASRARHKGRPDRAPGGAPGQVQAAVRWAVSPERLRRHRAQNHFLASAYSADRSPRYSTRRTGTMPARVQGRVTRCMPPALRSRRIGGLLKSVGCGDCRHYVGSDSEVEPYS